MHAPLLSRDALSVFAFACVASFGLVASTSATARDVPSTGSWSDLAGGVTGGQGTGIRALAVFDDGWGYGPVLYAAGQFSSAGGVEAQSIARWDGEMWSDVGGLSMGAWGAGYATAMTVLPTASGDVLVVAGGFSLAGGVPVTNLAVWDGKTWSALGAGLGGTGPESGLLGIPTDLTVHVENDPEGGRQVVRLYAAGTFKVSGAESVGPGLARYDDGVWTQVGPAITGASNLAYQPPKVRFHDDGAGPRPFLGGQSLESGGMLLGPLATLSDDAWVAADGIHQSPGAVWSLESYRIDGIDHLFAGGTMGVIGIPGRDGVIVRRQGAWSALGNGLRGKSDFRVGAIVALPDGIDGRIDSGGGDGGVGIYVGGAFTTAGGTPATNIARWNGTFWTELAQGVGDAPPPADDASDSPIQPATFFLAEPFAMILDPFAPPGAPRVIAAGGFSYAGDQLVNHIAAWTPPEILRPGPFPNRCAYDIEPIPAPFTIAALTEDELVAGTDGGGSYVVVDGILSEIEPPPSSPGSEVQLLDINDSHIAVGGLNDDVPGVPGGSRGFRLDLDSDEWTIFNADLPPCNGCQASAVGDDGTVHGWYDGAMYTWVDDGADGVTTFPPLDPGWTWMRPRAANALGEAVGFGSGPKFTPGPSLFDGSSIGGVAALRGLSGGQARAINDDGVIVGVVGESGGVGVIWEGGVASILPGIDGENADPEDINNAGVIVGRSSGPSGSLSQPAIWIDGTPQLLLELVSWRDAWRLGRPARINDAGTIAAKWSVRPFTTEPDGGALLRSRPVLGGDVDGDCRVNEYDLGLVLVEFGFRDSVADLDGDGVVDGFDLGLVLSNWKQ